METVDPFPFQVISNGCSSIGIGISFHELKDVDDHIRQSPVARKVKVMSDGFIKLFVFDVVEVTLEAVH